MKITVKRGQILHKGKVYYTGEALEVTDDTAKLLIAGDLAEPEEAETPEKSLEDMTVKELTAYAAERDIPIDAGTKKKADLLAAIRAAEDRQDGERQKVIIPARKTRKTGAPRRKCRRIRRGKPMSLRDDIKNDIKNIMNTSEFADFFQVNGAEITAIEDGDNLARRIQTDYGGMAIGDLLLHVAEDEWAKVPKVSHPPVQGEAVTVGKKPATIFTCSKSEGMLDIIFQYKRK